MRPRSSVLAALAVAVLAFIQSPRADASPAKAWAAAKANLPPSAKVVVGFDLAAIQRLAVVRTMLPLALAKQPEIKQALDLIKSTCKLDPMKVITGGVVATTGGDHKTGVVYLHTGGVDQARALACLEQIAGGPNKLVVRQDGAVTELVVDGDVAYVAWLGDVIAIPIDVSSKAMLQGWIGHRGAFGRSGAGKEAGRLDTRAALWVVTTVAETLDSGVKMTKGRGAVSLVKGRLVATLTLTVDGAKRATELAATATAALASLKASGEADIATLVDDVKVTAAGSDVTVKASIPEAELMTVIAALM
jgi:hypothetical protein